MLYCQKININAHLEQACDEACNAILNNAILNYFPLFNLKENISNEI